ncbi:receptor-like protein Cf-9 homolog [Solanum stenotomum]|uniref:receptor-like protein Cf-9 homolog n=1 Tax=Solanum stenotomum TaxID=172797 RepID=UPI0020D16805|nr:receptor-like protein Cf-9 homolog [Solanum stenotomum]
MELYLSNVNATGRIPESFGHLTSLRKLDLFSCNLSGSIPKPLWNLTNIETLVLAYNHLERPISNFFRFGKLKSLSIGNNNFNGQLEFLSLNTCTQLVELDFSFNSLITGSIPSNEFKYQSLFVVSLKQNQLEGPIPKSFLYQQILHYLFLSQNNLSGQITSTICNRVLMVLDLGSNSLEGTIPLCLGEISILRILDLSNNSLSGTLNTNFSIGNYLGVIKFDRNKLEGKVPQSFINCKYLKVLDLGNNELNDTFPEWLGALPELQLLNLRSNKFYGPIKDSRTDNLFAQIRIIDLSSNGFSGDLPVSLFENFEAMKIIGEKNGTREYVADYYSNFYSNSFIVTTKGLELQFPRVLTTNIIINLSNNKFEGHIPSIIGDLIGLRTLNLSHNCLEGFKRSKLKPSSQGLYVKIVFVKAKTSTPTLTRLFFFALKT